MPRLKQRVFTIIEKAKNGDKYSSIFDKTIIGLIILNMIAVILESFQSFAGKYSTFLSIFEIISIIVFTIEYFLRIWTADLLYPKKKGWKARLQYIFSFMALIDLLAILPFYIPMLIKVDLRFLRVLRIARMLRVFKINRYTKALSLIGKVIKKKREELLVTVFITIILLILSSSIMYYIETDVQPDNFPNIIAAFWWGISTLTTIGYGDIYPISVMGKVLSGIIALLGIGLVAMPTGIISSGFIEEMNSAKHCKKYKYCPYCGEKLE